MTIGRSRAGTHGRRASLRTFLLGLTLAAAGLPPGFGETAPARAQGAWPGEFSAPFAEDPTFDERPPRTIEEARRTPPAVSMAMMPDGRVLYWGGWGDFNGDYGLVLDGGRIFRPHPSRILDLRSGTPRWSAPGNNTGGPIPEEDLFCADQRVLADGRVVAIGGTIYANDPVDLTPVTGDDGPAGTFETFGSSATRWVDFRSDEPAWIGSDENRMHSGRWYPTAVTLPDGRLLVASGFERVAWNVPPLEGGRGGNVPTLETFDPATNRWTQEPASAEISLPMYPRLHLTHDGNVLYTGAGFLWLFGQAPDQALWALHRVFDPARHAWSVAGVGAYGARSDPLSVPLILEPPYDETRILVAAGTLGPPPTAVAGTTLSEIVTYRGGVTSSEATGPLNNPRWFSSGVLLPNGHVLALSGGDKNDNVVFGGEAAVRQAEVFDPDTGRWTPLASGHRDRTDHSSAILLPDGRVLVGGHAPTPELTTGRNNPDAPTYQAGLTANNLLDPSFEIFTPPYLDPALGPRPRITFAPAAMAYGTSPSHVMTVEGEVARVVLLHLPAATHVLDADQRGIQLPFERIGNALHVTPPPDGDVAPPGYYYLFAVSDTGVPSKARIVQVGASPPAEGPAPAPFGIS